MTTTTTTKPGRKIATRKGVPASTPSKKHKPYTRKQLADEFLRLTGEDQDAAYLADLVSGARKNNRIGEKAKEAAHNLEAQAQHTEAPKLHG